MFTTIGLYTKKTEYEKVMEECLLPSLQKLDLSYKIYSMESLKDWNKNTNLKQMVYKQALEELDTDILCLDADCKIYSYPKILDDIPEEYDMAMLELDWNVWYLNNSNIKELLIGTLFIRNRPICKKFIDEWIKNESFGSSQKKFTIVLENFPDLKIYKLPFEYCWIHSLPGNREPYVKRPENVIVEHFQISRVLKRSL